MKTTGHDRTHFTCSELHRSRLKLPPMMIFKWMTMPKKKKFPKKKSWLKSTEKKALLLLDSMRAHITDSVKAAIKRSSSIPAVIPGGTTKYWQPFDISVNCAFKDALRAESEAWMTCGEKSYTKMVACEEQLLTAWRNVKKIPPSPTGS